MSGFSAPPTTTQVQDVVDGDGWWPDCSIAAFRRDTRIDTTTTDTRIRAALIAAMFRVAAELADWRAAQQGSGVARLGDIIGPTFGGETKATSCWRQAVGGYAAADLADTHSDISATEAGRDRNAVRATSADEHRRNAVRAIRALKGARSVRLA